MNPRNVPRRTARFPRRQTAQVIWCLAALTQALLTSRATHAGLDQTGRWQGPYPLGSLISTTGYVGVHVAVLHGPADTTRALMFGEHGAAQKIAAWSFVPKAELTIPKSETNTPDPALVNVHGVVRPSSGGKVIDMFCGGHSGLPSGRLLVVGGEYDPPIGTEMPFEFNPLYGSPTNPASVWQQRESMARGRWYPSITELGSGDLMASSGTKFTYLLIFEGETATPQLLNDMHPLAVANTVDWKTPTLTGYPFNSKDHSAVMDDMHPWYSMKRMVIFGGQTGPDAAPTKTNAVWGQHLDPDDSSSTWIPFTIYPAAEGLPVPRSRHSALYNKSVPNGTPALVDGEMFVYGGRDESGNALGDVWKLRLHRMISPFGAYAGTWTRILENSDGGPGNRYGHTAIFDTDPLNNHAPRMLVFGGRHSPTELAAAKVWSLNLSGTPVWTEINPGGGPTPREGHSAYRDFYDQLGGQTEKFRMVVFGGHDGTSPLNQTWSLWRPGTNNTWGWALIPIVQPPDSVPPARWRHAASAAGVWDRMMVFGGGGAAGPLDDLWYLDLDDVYDRPSNPHRWYPATRRTPPIGGPSAPPAARAGHTIVADAHEIIERVPEIFDHDFLSPTPRPLQPGAWETKPSAHTPQNPYPLIFQLPSGNVLHAGTEVNTTVLHTGSWTWAETANDARASSAGSAVMYRPGSVLRCGSLRTEEVQHFTDTIQFVGAVDTDDPWLPVADDELKQMFPRRFHNLTILPTGDVLVTGGLRSGPNDPQVAEQRPQIWRPLSGSWRDYSLSAEPATRNYHSAAILLPCGRILSTGGERNGALENPSRFEATIFEPPYLFTGDNPAQRPTIASAPCRLGYGCEFFIHTPDTLSMGTGSTVCLIRPGAVTHGFNQDQHFVPLNMYGCASGGRLRIANPASANIAPQGDYLLFIVNSSGVPSVGKWLRVGPDLPGTAICDADVPNRVNAPDPWVEIESDTEMWLVWTAPGDDDDPPLPGPTGTVSEYDLRASTQSMTNNEALFCQARRGHWVTPVSPAGAPQYGYVSGLAPCTQYRFALKARDEVANWSPTGNEISAITLCGGGGGGSSAHQVATLVGATPTSEALSDGNNGNAPTSGGSFTVDAAPAGLLPQDGLAWAAEMRLSGDAPTWSVYPLGDQEAQSLFAEDGARILVQGPEGESGRTTLARYVPAAGSTRFAVHRLRQPGRIVFRGGYEFRQAWSAVATGTAGEVYAIVSARHSRLGDQTAVMDRTGTTTAALEQGDTLSLTYQRTPSDTETAQGWFLLIGEPGTVAPAAGNRRLPLPESPGLPQEFALHANHPNPFVRLTSLRFALPKAERVQLEVFDILGRHIRTLADVTFAAGEHSVPWDGRDDHGVPQPPGIYHARIRAGEFRSQRTMVLLP